MPSFFCTIALLFGLAVSVPLYVAAIPALLCGVRCVYCLMRKSRGTARDTSSIVMHFAVLSVFLLYWLLRNGTSFFYHVLHSISLGISWLAGALISRPITMSVTYSGIDIAALFLIAAVTALIVYREKSPWPYIAGIAALFAVWVSYIALWTVLAENAAAIGLNRIEPLTGPLDFRSLLFCAQLAIWMALYKWLQRRKARGAAWRSKRALPITAGVAGICTAALLISMINPPSPGAVSESAVSSAMPVRQIVFWDSGIDFSLPQESLYGLEHVGMFGVLPHYLARQGYACRIAEDLDEAVLSEADALVIINPARTPNQESLEAIWRFVENGGGVLAVGDHTGDEHILKPFNAILQPVGIKFNFDSAIPFKTLWPDNYVTRRSPIFANVSYPQIQAVVGASLDLGFGARPLLIGRNGFSDQGNLLNADDGFLGNMRFDRGEPVGDMILAAEAKYGSGMFLVFGDTTMFQNTVLTYSRVFIDNIFAHVTSNASAPLPGTAQQGLLLRETCLIDASHMPSFSFDKGGEALDGFIACALRAGVFPEFYFGKRLTPTAVNRDDLRLIVLAEPALSYSKEELSLLYGFVQRGGTLALFGNYQSPKATHELFGYFGFSFDNMPLGRVAPLRNPDMAFWNACPVYYDGQPVTNAAPGAESIMEAWGECVIARLEIGSGQVYAFGDSGFIKNQNLEYIEEYREGNIEFIIDLLRHREEAG